MIQRLKNLGVEEVNLNGLKIDMQNSLLQGFEDESKFGKLNIRRVTTYSKNNTERAGYINQLKQIRITTKMVNKKVNLLENIVLSYEDQIKEIEKEILIFEEKYLGNYLYKQSQVFSARSKMRGQIRDLEYKIKNGETAKPWSISSTQKDKNKGLYATITHELGHHRHMDLLDSNMSFDYDIASSVSEYGKTNNLEYFAEWFAHYRLNGEKDVPADILQLFKSIENGK